MQFVEAGTVPSLCLSESQKTGGGLIGNEEASVSPDFAQWPPAPRLWQ